jgi:hypothetical protein
LISYISKTPRLITEKRGCHRRSLSTERNAYKPGFPCRLAGSLANTDEATYAKPRPARYIDSPITRLRQWRLRHNKRHRHVISGVSRPG